MPNNFKEQEFSKNFDPKVWKRLFVFMKAFKWKFIAAMASIIVLTLIDVLYPIFAKTAIDTFIIPKSTVGLEWFIVALVGIILLQVFSVYFMIIMNGKIDAGLPYSIRKALFEKLQTLSLSYFNKTPSGWLLARLSSDIRKIGNAMTWNLIDLTWSLFTMIFVAISMFLMNWKLALIALLALPLLIFLSMIFQKLILKSYRRVRKVNSNIINSFSEGISGARTIKTLVAEDTFTEEFQNLTQEMKKVSIRTGILSAVYTPIVITLGVFGTALVLWQGGAWTLNDLITLGTLTAFITYTTQFFEPVKQLARLLGEMQSTQASAERVFSVLDIDPEVKDTTEIIQKYGDILHPKTAEWPDLHGEIEFRDVCFSYEGDDSEVLESFSLKIAVGETVALVGETGSGKTTIANLLSRFYEPVSGQILIDGIDYKTLPMLWLQSNLGYVLQDPHLFNGTIFDNIIYSNASATREDVEAAAKLVNAYGFITNLDEGFDTNVGERGIRLSIGQRQLVSFARAILAKPKIIILDEATSSVDTETEHLIKDAIDKILAGRTSLIIAHRLSTIKSADRILVLDAGDIVEEGDHDTLMRLKGRYFNLYTNQFMTAE